MIEWKTLDKLEQLEDIQDHSFTNVQVIFKHSTTCPISHMAKSRVESDWDLENITPYYLDLKQFRDVSNTIESKWSIEHQSPQIILIKDGKAIYDESHLDITIAQLHKVLQVSNA